MSGTKPTPGPWQIDDVTALGREITIYGPPGIGAHAICEIGAHIMRDRREEKQANARLIVRAVNCHADLVAALAPLAKIADWHETMLLTDEHTIIGFSGETEHFRLTLGDCRKARAALAKAGETP